MVNWSIMLSWSGMITVIVVSVCALGCYHDEERSPTRDSNDLGCCRQTGLGLKVETLVYSHEDKHSHMRRLGSATGRQDTTPQQKYRYMQSHNRYKYINRYTLERETVLQSAHRLNRLKLTKLQLD